MVPRKWLETWVQRVCWMLCGLLAISAVGANIAGKLKVAMLRHGIIPEIMMQAPKLGIYVAYGKKFTAKFGNLVPIEVTGTQPSTMKWKTLHNAVYTVVVMDLDAIPLPHRTAEMEVERLLWLVVNIPAAHNVNVSTGQVLAPYIGPTLNPKAKDDPRILFLVFEQPLGKTNFSAVPVLDATPDDPRRNEFNIHKFVEDYRLGKPVAVNFYCTRKDLLLTTAAPLRKRKTLKPAGPKTTTPELPVVTAERFDADDEDEDEDE